MIHAAVYWIQLDPNSSLIIYYPSTQKLELGIKTVVFTTNSRIEQFTTNKALFNVINSASINTLNILRSINSYTSSTRYNMFYSRPINNIIIYSRVVVVLPIPNRHFDFTNTTIYTSTSSSSRILNTISISRGITSSATNRYKLFSNINEVIMYISNIRPILLFSRATNISFVSPVRDNNFSRS